MFQTLRHFMVEYAALLWWLAAASGVMLLLSILALPLIAVMLPQDFIVRKLDPQRPVKAAVFRRPALRLAALVLKNLAGGVLAVAGLAMLILPGQGLLTLAFALLFLDIPGKDKLEARILNNARLLKLINRLRQRFGRPPLESVTN